MIRFGCEDEERESGEMRCERVGKRSLLIKLSAGISLGVLIILWMIWQRSLEGLEGDVGRKITTVY